MATERKTKVYGIWNSIEKRFVFGIREESADAALRKFRRVAPGASRAYRYSAKEIPEGHVNRKNPRVKWGWYPERKKKKTAAPA